MDSQLKSILELLARTPSADNSQPWRFAIGKSSICCHSIPAEECHGPFGPLGHATLLSAGAMHESMSQLFGDESSIESIIDGDRWSIELTYGTLPNPQGTAARKLANRHTNRFPYTHEPVVCPPLPNEWPGGGRAIPIVDPIAISAIAAAVQTCSAVRFNCRELHEWLFSSLRWNDEEAAQGDGLDIASLYLPPGGKQFMRFLASWQRMKFLNRLGLYKIMATADARLIFDAPAILAIVGQRGSSSVWEAGRIMQASWVALNTAGLAVHPYYVVTDITNRLATGTLEANWHAPVEKQLDKLGKLLGLSPNHQIHMLLRIGTPSRAAKLSARLPLERLVDQPVF